VIRIKGGLIGLLELEEGEAVKNETMVTNKCGPARQAGSACRLTFALAITAMLAIGSPAQAEPAAKFPGKLSDWHGFQRYDFTVNGKPALVVVPKQPAPGNPWVWHGEFFGHKPAPDIALLGRGFHIVYLRVPDMLGCPQAVQHWNAFYAELTQEYGFAKKPALVGLSRGGLYCYNWAEANPDKVACIYGDAPVCDFKSWPGGKGKGKGSPRDWKLVLETYGFQDDAEALAYDKNPVDNLEPLAKAGVPLLHVYGDADDVVPWDENTGILAERYRKLGGSITLIAKPGVGHHPHGLDDSTPIVEFIARHADVSAAADEPPAGFVSLFNGKDLTGWEQMNGSKFVATEGVIKHDQGLGWLRTKEQYDNFVLRLEVRWLKDRQDSGVFLRAGLEGDNWPTRKYEVQCENSERIVHIFGTNCQRDAAKAQALLKPTGEWNLLEIHCNGARCEVRLNGELASSADNLAPGKGYLGLQGENGRLEFRNLLLKPLDSAKD
jgi:pimeloyl-ACP methyl ester carboxylesterase